MSKIWIFVVLGFLLYVEAQEGRLSRDWRSRRRRPSPERRRGPRVPDWCPRGSPRIRCFANPCDVERCPSFPHAICLNDNPCERACSGSFYTEERGRLSRSQCNGQGGDPPGIPDWCPVGSPRIFCLVSPCSAKQCPGVPQAKCLADNPCEQPCSGDFYVVRGRRRGQRHGRKLSESQCAASPPGGGAY
ncbi:uncharacterized protein LOC123531609 [Mercenaria mercenaria]|uniref:uncharacterized protein LOC123531609 n=1 Tax=Mercenaria mercenaria TaxID=6596 RepID=UPI001E1D4C9D|nr:uncharacterized protein LOC123531609 [Mercenaria mercenaria]